MAYVLDRNPCGSSSGTGVGVCGRPRDGRRRHRDRRLDRLPVGRQRHRRASSPRSGCGAARGRHPDLGRPGHGRSDDPQRHRRRRRARRGHRASTPTTRRPPARRATPERLHRRSSTSTRSRARGSASGARAPPTRHADAPRSTRSWTTSIAHARGAGRDGRRPGRGPARTRLRRGVPGAAVRVQDDIAGYLETYTAAGYPKTLADLIDFNEATPTSRGRGTATVRGGRGDRRTRRDRACQRRATPRRAPATAIDAALAEHDLDAIIGPTNGPAWVTDPVNGDGTLAVRRARRARRPSPAIRTSPCRPGTSARCRSAMSFIGARVGRAGADRVAYDFEQATRVRVPPQFLPTLGASRQARPRPRAPRPRPGRSRAADAAAAPVAITVGGVASRRAADSPVRP